MQGTYFLLIVSSLFIYGSFFMLSYLVYPEKSVKNFAEQDGLAFGLLILVAESVITHYVLIFVVLLPAMHGQQPQERPDHYPDPVSVETLGQLLINPHFLFNSLSFIYGKVIKTDRETADSVLMLANIMRYALGTRENTGGKVNILDELEHLKNVIEINQRRHKDIIILL